MRCDAFPLAVSPQTKALPSGLCVAFPEALARDNTKKSTLPRKGPRGNGVLPGYAVWEPPRFHLRLNRVLRSTARPHLLEFPRKHTAVACQAVRPAAGVWAKIIIDSGLGKLKDGWEFNQDQK
jgi:hypothetical protein